LDAFHKQRNAIAIQLDEAAQRDGAEGARSLPLSNLLIFPALRASLGVVDLDETKVGPKEAGTRLAAPSQRSALGSYPS
jgi:hypothetical protein